MRLAGGNVHKTQKFGIQPNISITKVEAWPTMRQSYVTKLKALNSLKTT